MDNAPINTCIQWPYDKDEGYILIKCRDVQHARSCTTVTPAEGRWILGRSSKAQTIPVPAFLGDNIVAIVAWARLNRYRIHNHNGLRGGYAGSAEASRHITPNGFL